MRTASLKIAGVVLVIASVAALAAGLLGAYVLAEVGTTTNSFIRVCSSSHPESCVSASKETAAVFTAVCLISGAVLMAAGIRWLRQKAAR